jgi:small subunit ribosomal protein S1
MTSESNLPGKNAPKGPKIQWEDEGSDFQFDDQEGYSLRAGEESAPEIDASSNFEAMLAQNEPDEHYVKIGERIKGRVAIISEMADEVMIDLGGKLSGVISKSELQDEAGQLKVKVGEMLEAFVLARQGNEITLGMKKAQSLKSFDDLEHAYREKLAVRGRVVKLNKGGFEVLILGKPAFCPISQIDSKFVDKPEDYLNQEFEFLLERFDPRGRNLVVSRARLLKQLAVERTRELITQLKPDTVLDGVVTQIRDFGAFVDIGGVEGMVHISALSLSRVSRVADVVAVGDKVSVKVLRIEGEQGDRPKISLSMKATSQDPWDAIENHIKIGESYTGKVVNLMNFGAFIEVKPGLEGLLHVSEMSWTKRVHHPSDVVKVGDVVSVTVREINSLQKRISLSMKQVEDDPWFDAAKRFPAEKTVIGKVERLRPFGAIVELAPGLGGLLPTGTLKKKFGDAYKQHALPGKELEVKVVNLDLQNRQVLLTLPGIDGADGQDADGREDYLAYVRDVMTGNDVDKSGTGEKSKSGESEGRVGSFGALLSQSLKK